MYQIRGSKKNVFSAVFTVLVYFCFLCPQGADAHPVTVWPSRGDDPAFTADVSSTSTIGVTVTVPAPIFTPASSPSYFTDVDVRAFKSGAASSEMVSIADVTDAKKMEGNLTVDTSGTIVLASAAQSSATSTIRHFSKSFLNAARDGVITQPTAPMMTAERLEVVPMDDAHKLVKGATMRFQMYYEGELVTGEELEAWVNAVTGGDVNASPEFNLGFAYVNEADTDAVAMEEGEDYDIRDLEEIVEFDFEEGIISVTFNKAAYWFMELYKPRGLAPNTSLSQFATLTFEVAETPHSDDSSSCCNAGFGTFTASLLLCAGAAVLARRREK